MKYLMTSLLTLISLSLWASGGPKDALEELERFRQEMRAHDYGGDDDDDYPFSYPFSDVDLTPLPFSAVNAPPSEICTETPDDQQGSLNGTWPVAESEEGKFQAEIQRLMKQRELEASKTKTFKSDWERLQETASQSGLRGAPDSTPRIHLGEFVKMTLEATQSATLPDSPPNTDKYKPLKRRPLVKKKVHNHHRNKYKMRMISGSVLPDLPTIGQNQFNLDRFKRELLQLRHSLCKAEAEADKRASKDEKEILEFSIQSERIRKIIHDKTEDEKEEAKKITLEGYLSQYLKIAPAGSPSQRPSYTQISSPTPKLSRLGQIYVVPNEDQDVSFDSYEDWRSVLTESKEIDDLPYEDSDTEVDSPPVARKSQSPSD